ncbi:MULTISPECIES: DEAD/DEAH box helicase [Actinosynnema]|uniref:DEAD/DEAH box helicase n=1 Tax=Actinosynnema TaxID=40566 RepID=UPI0020A5801B|nr:DEAD/DEAH box helicase [Actinosynnema pretiosum]MCP2097295.1 Helicase C-terminal domain-containing protein [Actinosynnema pretiosum]
MAFKRSSGTSAIPNDPVQLYRKLAETNDGPESLWFHQGTVLKDWHKNHATGHDVAIELPTGAGKTLVGGLIGDYRRRAFRERVAYLCPTRQLARQTADKLTEYGIPNVLLIGKVRKWNKADRARYTAANAIAVSVYHHVFNSNPALDDAQLLLLDDAHAAETAVASPWSLKIDRANEDSAYFDVLSALAGALDPLVLARLRRDTTDSQYRNTVYLASPLGVATQATHLEQTLDAAVDADKISEAGAYALEFLRGNLDKCLVYLSHRSLLIRPLIPPTLVHPAFDNPARRIYMSATLGAGGELERIFGRRKITRIPIPEGWEKQGTGRRLFCFPQLTSDLAADPDKVDTWIADVVAEHGRAVVMTPDTRTADAFADTCLPEKHEVFRADDVEDDLAVFTDEPAAALVLNNRYDGIDLPDDDCRLVVLAGLPARGDLQERFLHGSLGAIEVLQERIRARIMQGAGRATRNAKDFAAVLVLDDELVSYVTRRDVQEAMHPEIHAELEFGYRHSIDHTSAEMRENLRIFAEHGAEWREVDQDIVDDREQYERVDAPGTAELQRAVSHEVVACEAIWQGEWSRALDCIREVLDALRGGRAPQRYAALWNYLASCIAHRLARQAADPVLGAAATKFYGAARAAGRGTTWLSNLAAPVESGTVPEEPALDPLDEQAMAGVLANAARLAKPTVFDTEVRKARAALLATPHKPYEAALVVLGRLAGAVPSEGDGNNQAAPDAIWVFGSTMWVAWEAKSEAGEGGELGAEDVRQAGGHLRFTAKSRAEAAPGDSPTLLMTPQARVHPSAHAVAESHVYLLRPDAVIDLFDRIVRAWRTARTRDLDSLTPADLAAVFAVEGALPSQWLPRLRTVPLRQDQDVE